MGRRTARKVDNRGQKLDRVAQRPAAPGAAVRRYRTDAAAMLREPCRMTDAEAAVLEAARKWIAAKEEMLAPMCGWKIPPKPSGIMTKRNTT